VPGADAGAVVMRQVSGWPVGRCFTAAVLTVYPSNRLTAQSHDVILAPPPPPATPGCSTRCCPCSSGKPLTVKVIAVAAARRSRWVGAGTRTWCCRTPPDAERALVRLGFLHAPSHGDAQRVPHRRAGADPTGLRGLSDPVVAFRRIAERRGTFVSRGDQSGTHQREQLL